MNLLLSGQGHSFFSSGRKKSAISFRLEYLLDCFAEDRVIISDEKPGVIDSHGHCTPSFSFHPPCVQVARQLGNAILL